MSTPLLPDRRLAECSAYYGYYVARHFLEYALGRLGRAHRNHAGRDAIRLADESVAAAMAAVERADERIKGLEGER